LKYKQIYSIGIFLFGATGGLFGQSAPYFLGVFPEVFAEAEKQLQQEEVDSVFELVDAIIEQEKDAKVLGVAYFYRGEAAALQNNFQIASASFLNALDFFESANYPKGLAVAYCKLGDLYFFHQDFTIADSLYNESISRSEKLALNDVLYDLYLNKSMVFTDFQNGDSSMFFAKKALAKANLLGDQEKAKNVLNQIATTYHSIGELDSAIAYFRKGIAVKENLQDSEGLISDYSAIGNLFRERGDFEQAQMFLFKGLKVAENQRDTFAIMALFSEIGDVYATQKGWGRAEDYYQKAMKLARLKNRQFVEAGCLDKLGDVYQNQGKEALAIGQYEAALELYEQFNNRLSAAALQLKLGKLYKDGNQLQKARAYLREALAVRKQSADRLGVLQAKMALAEIEILSGGARKSIGQLNTCLEEFAEMDDLEGRKNALLLLSEAYAKIRDYGQALQFYQQYHVLIDSLTSIDRSKAVSELGMRYATVKKDKEIAQQKVAIEQQRVAIKERNNQLLMLASGLLLVGLLAAFLFYSNRKNKQLNQKQIEVLKKEQEAQRLRAVIDGEEKERKRLAEELHDGLGAVLATVKMQISSIQNKLPAVSGLPTYQKAETLIDDACRTVREISHGLTPLIIEQQGLEYALAEMCHTLAANNPIEFEFIPHGTDRHLSGIVKMTVYRIAQEVLKNILKHAAAKEVIVQLTIEENELLLIIEDDGKGFDVASSNKGIGLENIRSRTAYLDGTLDIDSVPGEGTTFTINLPLTTD